MARSTPKDRVKATVEALTASCRTLADAMRSHANSLGLTQRRERRLINGWADLVDGIADAMTAAVHDKDPGTLRQFWGLARWVIMPIGFVSGPVADGLTIIDHFTDNETVIGVAQEIHQRAELDMSIVSNWDPNAPALEPQTVEAGRFGGNRVQYGERDENGRPVNVEATARPDTMGMEMSVPVPTITGTIDAVEGDDDAPGEVVVSEDPALGGMLDADGKPFIVGASLLASDPGEIINLGYIGSDLAAIGEVQPKRSLNILRVRQQVGRLLQTVRLDRGLDTSTVARRLGLTEEAISGIESGQTNQTAVEAYIPALGSMLGDGDGPDASVTTALSEALATIKSNRPS